MWRTPAHYVHAGGAVVVVPARVAAWLVARAQLDGLRTEVRGADPEVDSVLIALTVSAMHWRTSATGSAHAPEPEVGRRSSWMNTTEASDHLHVTSRAVRLAIADGRLPADRVDGRWRISRENVEHYRAGRRAA